MSAYYPTGFYGQRNAGAPGGRSVYYYPTQQQQPTQAPEGSSLLPPGAVPVINLPAPGIAPQGYQPLQQPVAQAPQVQYSSPATAFQVQAPLAPASQAPPTQFTGPVFVDSDYAAAGWGAAPYHVAPTRVVDQQAQRAQGFNGPAETSTASYANAAFETARSEYEQALAQAQRAAERLNQLASAPQPQVSVPSISRSGHQGFGQEQAAPQGRQPPPQQYQQAPPQQLRFANASEAAPTGSSYRFEEVAPAPRRQNNQAPAASVYYGIPNDNQHAWNRGGANYPYTPQYQEGNTQGQARGEANLRPALSQDDVRTAVESIAATAVLAAMICQDASAQQAAAPDVASSSADGSGGGQSKAREGSSLQAGNSDYHFGGLRDLSSALDQRS